ncbi:flagellar protein, partial [Pseudomonas sp. BGM005]|nr:flagellar protein [Pseudomonas sp. BG5]
MKTILNHEMTVLQLLRRLALPAAGLVLLSIP